MGSSVSSAAGSGTGSYDSKTLLSSVATAYFIVILQKENTYTLTSRNTGEFQPKNKLMELKN